MQEAENSRKKSNAMTIKEIEIGDYVRTTYKNRKLIMISTAAIALIAIIYSLLTSKIYTGRASFFSPSKTSSNFPASGASDKLPQFLSSYLKSDTKAKLFISFLESRNLSDKVINHFDLMKYYDVENMDRARKQLRKSAFFKAEESELITISANHKDPKIASDIANFYLSEVDKLNRELNVTEAGRQRVFLENRIGKIKDELTTAEDELAEFQVSHNVLSIENQATATVNIIAGLRQEQMKSRIELGILNSYASNNDSDIFRLKQSIKETDKQLEKLTGNDGDKQGKTVVEGQKGKKPDVIIPAKMLPELTVQYLRLLRKVTVLQTLYSLLVQQYELAKLEEAKDSSTIMVLDQAVPPDVRSKPQRSLIVIAFTILGFIFVSGFFFVKEIAFSVLSDLRKSDIGE